jgi:hypothetical protein
MVCKGLLSRLNSRKRGAILYLQTSDINSARTSLAKAGLELNDKDAFLIKGQAHVVQDPVEREKAMKLLRGEGTSRSVW